MKINDCIFCKIVRGELPSFKIYEDNHFIAILDLFPNTKGMTLVITKEHFDSYVFEMPEDIYTNFFLTAKKIAKVLDKKLKVQRTALVMEGMGVNHAHLKLYPLHGLENKFTPISPPERKFFHKYEGYLCTYMGEKAAEKDLKELQQLLSLEN